LRTPLNSLLILSQQLADNPNDTLTGREVEFAQTIRASGEDLLTLINDILDLSKIESGTTSIDVRQVTFSEIEDDIERTFRQIAEQKQLGLSVTLAPGLPRTVSTDPTRLMQILKNLVANAFKFTDNGSVDLGIRTVARGWSEDHESLNRARQVLAFAVRDTGIGISADKQALVFEAFQQADMDTSRRYGGTGLGLAISREIAQLLGGEISLSSTPGQGSTFTLYLPVAYEPRRNGNGQGGTGSLTWPSDAGGRYGNGSDNGGAVAATSSYANTGGAAGQGGTSTEASSNSGGGLAVRERNQPSMNAGAAPATDIPADDMPEVADDRQSIEPDDRVLLIVEDDARFATILLALARERGFKGVVTHRGDTGVALARRFRPDAMTLDLRLPELDGWKVLDLLKHDPATRHIPVHIISATDQRQRALELGAIAQLTKPVERQALADALDRLTSFAARKMRRLLVVEDDETQRMAIVELIGNGDVETTPVATGAAALEALAQERYDCVVLDLGLPDMTGVELIERIRDATADAPVPVVIYTGKELTQREESQLRKLAETIIIKDVRSPERLLDETALFLHRVEAQLPEPKRRMLRELHRSDPVLAGRKVLIVDDDMRNIFALTSALERYQMDVSYAENGREGIDALKAHPDTDIVLMDIMMPELDGYETIRRIRATDSFAQLPIIALTAKAMRGDRERCIEAGASDYITKPVDVEQLVSLLRVWLYR
jgi:CheY-like chemotaxis protein